MTSFPITKPKTAFVFAGGGSRGAAQVGMLRALLESGISADLVVGSSVGAINAAYFAGNPTPKGVSMLEALWRGLRRTDILPLSWRRLLGFLRRRDHLATSDGLRHLLELHLPYRNLEDATLPLHVLATDMLSGEAVVLSRGPATQAILASSAIPGAFAPVEINRRLLCDGAIASNTPVRAAVTLGARRLIVLPTGTRVGVQRPPRDGITSAFHAIDLLTTCQFAAELERLSESIECHILPTVCYLGAWPLDFSRTSELLDEAYRNTRHWIDAGGMSSPARRTGPAAPRRSATWTLDANAAIPVRRSTQSIAASQRPFWRASDKQPHRAGIQSTRPRRHVDASVPTRYILHRSTTNDGDRTARLSRAVEQVP
jgi:NTE family protein